MRACHARGDHLLEPAIGEALSVLLVTPGCAMAADAGMGATCFALYDRAADALTAVHVLRRAQPNWRVRATGLR